MAKNEIYYKGKTYTKLRSGNCYLSMALVSDSLAANTFSAIIESDDKTLTEFERNDPLVYRYNGKQVGTFYVQSVQRIARNQYEFKCTSMLGVLSGKTHMGGIYDSSTKTTAGALIDDICGTIPHIVKNTLLDIKVYGWLPIDNARNNLARVLFAIGAVVHTDLDGVIHIDALWDGISGQQRRLCMDSKVEYTEKVSKVIVTEHQYVKSQAVAEDSLFEGTAADGDVITFQEPYHTFRAEGFTVKSSGANFAVLSGGTGKLYGKPYVHNMRDVERPVSKTNEPNVKRIDEATLVSLVNAASVADRMAEYYKRIQTIDAPAIYNGEKPGDRIMTAHPYDETDVDAVLSAADITLSNTLKANEKMLVGFVPQPPQQSYADRRVVLKGSGSFPIPNGTKTLRYVLISGAQGGTGGHDGEKGNSRTWTYQEQSAIGPDMLTYKGVAPNNGGLGGAGGAGGQGGRIKIGEIDVSRITELTYSCGVGGIGGLADLPGTEGTDTTLGSETTAGASASEQGYTDTVTGEVYALPGGIGLKGGRSAQYMGEIKGSGDLYKVEQGEIITDRNGKSWRPGQMIMSGTRLGTLRNSKYNFTVSNSLAGGPAVGRNGPNGPAAIDDTGGAAWHGMPGANGADAPPCADLSQNGNGGFGGNGGGGGAPGGWLFTPSTVNANMGIRGKGGKGGQGGKGSDGLIILYYASTDSPATVALTEKKGRFMVDRSGRQIVC